MTTQKTLQQGTGFEGFRSQTQVIPNSFPYRTLPVPAPDPQEAFTCLIPTTWGNPQPSALWEVQGQPLSQACSVSLLQPSLPKAPLPSRITDMELWT